MMTRLLPVFALLLAIGLYFLYLQPTYTNVIQSDQTQLASYQSALQAAQSFTAKQTQLTSQMNAISSADITRINAFLPDSVDNVQLILDLNSLAARSGMTLSNFIITNNATSTANSGSLTTSSYGASALTSSLDITVTAKGTYPAFRTFLTAAEASLRPLDVMEVNINNGTTGVYTYTIRFRIYWLT